MAVITNADDRRRKSFHVVLSAFIILIVLWTYKLSYPQSSLLSLPSTASSLQVAPIPERPTTFELSPSPDDGRWKSKSQTSNGIILASEAFNGTLTTKAAVIVETRFRTNLIPLIIHFSTVLGPTWPVLIYTSAESAGHFSASASLSRYIKTSQIQVRILPQAILITNALSVTSFMTKGWLWEDLDPVEHILVFQSDSMLCANAARSVEDYFSYDFVGAPVPKGKSADYNGGLSLRKRSSIMRVLEEFEWDDTKKDGDRFEDQWFNNRLKELQFQEEIDGIEPDADGAVKLPSMEVARTFSVESIDYPHPLGVHKAHMWSPEQQASLDEWCPEYQLCSVDPNENAPQMN